MGEGARPATCSAHQYATGRRPFEASASCASWTHVRQISTGSRDTAVGRFLPSVLPPPQLSRLWPGLEGNLGIQEENVFPSKTPPLSRGAIVEKLDTQAKNCAVWSNFFVGSTRAVCK